MVRFCEEKGPSRQNKCSAPLAVDVSAGGYHGAMGELLGALLFGWLWLSITRVLLWPLSPQRTRAWLIPSTLILVIGLFCLAAASDLPWRMSPLGLAVAAASLAFFLYRAHRQNVREEEEENAEEEEEDSEDEGEEEAPAPRVKAPPKKAARTPAPAATPVQKQWADAFERETSDGVFSGTTDDGERWRVDLEAMTVRLGENTYRLRRTGEGAWEAREKGQSWHPLEELDDHLPTIVDTRWRRFVRAGS